MISIGGWFQNRAGKASSSVNAMGTSEEKHGARKRPAASAAGAISKVAHAAVSAQISDLAAISAENAPSDDQIFYLRVLARYLCNRKGIKTLTLADSAEIKGSQKQKENKAQAFLNRYTRGAQSGVDYQIFWRGILRLYLENKERNIELFQDPIMREAFQLVFPQLTPNDRSDDSFIDNPLQRWFSIDPQRSKDVRRHYCGLWWIVRPSTGKGTAEAAPEFNFGLLNIPPEGVLNTPLPLFKFHQAASATNGDGLTSQGRVLALHSDQILLLGKRRGTQTPTQMSWKYPWDPERTRRETVIQGTIFTVNTSSVLIQSYFHGSFVAGSELLRGTDFDDVDGFLRGFLGVRSEAELAEVPTSVEEVQLLRQLQTHAEERPLGLSGLKGKHSAHRLVVPQAALDRLKATPLRGPILTIT
jgi:hypothetical protein